MKFVLLVLVWYYLCLLFISALCYYRILEITNNIISSASGVTANGAGDTPAAPSSAPENRNNKLLLLNVLSSKISCEEQSLPSHWPPWEEAFAQKHLTSFQELGGPTSKKRTYLKQTPHCNFKSRNLLQVLFSWPTWCSNGLICVANGGRASEILITATSIQTYYRSNYPMDRTSTCHRAAQQLGLTHHISHY